MSNMMLKIEADTGKLDASLKKADEGVRKLEASVKIGDRTMRANITTEEQAAKALDKFSEAARKAEAAEKNRMAVMAKGFSDTARRAAIEADEANFKRQMKNSASLQRAQEEQGSVFKRGATAAMGYAATLTGIGTAAAAAAVVIRTLTAEQENAIAKADRSNQSAKGLKEFIALQAEGPEGKAHVQNVVNAAAMAGLKSDAAGAIAQPIQSVVDADGDGKLNEKEKAKFDEDFGAALTLTKNKVAPEDAATVITANRTRGISGSAAANKLIAAADKSVGGPADFARAASAINQFEDSDAGLAAATALTAEGTPLEQLSTLTRGAALTLGSANDDSEFSKKFGLAGLSEAEKVGKLREEGDKRGTLDPKRAEELMQQYIVDDGMDPAAAREKAAKEARIDNFSRSFKSKEGGSLDEEKARAMGLLVRQGDKFDSTLEAVKAAGGSGLAEQKAAALAADPITGSAMRSDTQSALLASADMYGEGADEARDKRDRALARAAALKQYGGDIAIDPSTGLEKNPFTNPIDAARGYGAARAAGMPENYVQGADKMSGQEMLTAAMAGLQKSLDANTAATEKNSGATKTTKPVGGAASNAEEKY